VGDLIGAGAVDGDGGRVIYDGGQRALNLK
jgi:hypothetical protein